MGRGNMLMRASSGRVPRYAVRTQCAVALALAASGCESFTTSTCDTSIPDNPAVTYAGGVASGGVYLSAPWEGPLFWFPGGTIYEIQHHLDAMPRWISVWVSFSEDGAAGGGQLARASGNEAVILGVDSSTITVENAGCQNFWLLVGAGTGATQPSPP
jgi:hypothetical protein